MKISLYRPHLYKYVYIVGSLCLDVFFYVLLLIATTFLFVWVFVNKGHIKTDDYSHSTLNLKTQEVIYTNFSAEDFNNTYVKPNEFQNYNKIWDRSEFVTIEPDEIQFMTNMVITANQTRGKCPDSPMIRNVECDPKNNKCRKGFRSSNGIHTGNCVRADFPLNHTYQYNNGFACEMIGWCPVDRFLVPLNNYRPILLETINSTLYIDNSVEFPNHDIVINNLFHFHCLYHPTQNADCPIFKLGDIIKFIQNPSQSYEEMAKFGATIDINIEWKCYKSMFSPNITDCKPKYSFRRVDVWENRSRFMYYTGANNYGNKRDYTKGYRIRFAVKVEATLSQFDFFKFSVVFMAYTPIAWTLVCVIFRRFAKFLYPGYIINNEKVIDVSKINHRFRRNLDIDYQTVIINEDTLVN